MYSEQDVIEFIAEKHVKYIRLSFIDVYGIQKDIVIQPSRLSEAFSSGISFDGSAIPGFQDVSCSDLILKPDADTMAVLPWCSSDDTAIRMYCDIYYPDGTRYEKDPSYLLKQAIQYAGEKGIEIEFGNEFEFYLFQEDGSPLDTAGYMDITPEDQGEDVRRQICQYLNCMHIEAEASYHGQGTGQNKIEFCYLDSITSARNAATFRWVVKTVARSNGLEADFDPKPIPDQPGNGMHMHISTNKEWEKFMGGILHHITEMTLFLNPSDRSYRRLGQDKAPKYISWGHLNRSTLIRIPSGKKRLELRSPDPATNPFLAYALIIYAGLDGIRHEYPTVEETTFNLDDSHQYLEQLPVTWEQAKECAGQSAFIQKYLPKDIIEAYL